MCVWFQRMSFAFAFCLLFFFFFFSTHVSGDKCNRGVLFSTVWPCFFDISVNQWARALFMDPQISFFINFFIKNGSHSTIYTFKNYFATVFSVFSFQFQQNKFYPNTPKYNFSAVWKARFTCFFSGAFLDGGSCEPVHCSWDL